MRFVPAPEGHLFVGPVWLPGTSRTDRLVVSMIPVQSVRGADYQLFVMDADGSHLSELAVPDDPGCASTSRYDARPLPDGRLGYLQRCLISASPARRIPEESVTLMALGPETGEAERLVPYYLGFNAHMFDFAPDMRRGIINDGRGLHAGLLWLLPQRTEPVTLPVPFELVGYPSWSPDGRTIAFPAAPTQSGRRVTGPSRADLPLRLYLLSVASGVVHPLTDSRTNQGPPAWSPDGKWLAAFLDFDSPREGLWLIEVATGKRHLLVPGSLVGPPSWSPDGRTLVAATGVDIHARNLSAPKGLLVIDLPDLGSLASSAAG
jgi:hypothetical protein